MRNDEIKPRPEWIARFGEFAVCGPFDQQAVNEAWEVLWPVVLDRIVGPEARGETPKEFNDTLASNLVLPVIERWVRREDEREYRRKRKREEEAKRAQKKKEADEIRLEEEKDRKLTRCSTACPINRPALKEKYPKEKDYEEAFYRLCVKCQEQNPEPLTPFPTAPLSSATPVSHWPLFPENSTVVYEVGMTGLRRNPEDDRAGKGKLARPFTPSTGMLDSLIPTV